VANVAVGFDILGFAIHGVGDRVTVSKDSTGRGVLIESIGGIFVDLPTDPQRNTASAALLAMIEDRRLDHGFRISIEKGIPLGSGMGGSAASAVAAVVAANRLLAEPAPSEELLAYCMVGERAASGAAHADNVAPCLYGGLTAVVASDPPRVVQIPLPPGLLNVLVHPHLEVATRDARAALRHEVPLAEAVEQSMYLCGFLAGCFTGDAGLVGGSLVDLFAEPTRSRLIPGFAAARAAALERGALGLAISGSGPSVFAWATTEPAARQVEAAVRQVFDKHALASDSWVGPINHQGAVVEPAGR
jgi:homoserine kinase